MTTTEKLIQETFDLAAYSVGLNESLLAPMAPKLARLLQKAIEQRNDAVRDWINEKFQRYSVGERYETLLPGNLSRLNAELDAIAEDET